MISTSFTEFFTLALVMPFLLVISSPELTSQNEIIIQLVKQLGIEEIKDLQLILSIAFMICAIVACCMKTINLRSYIYLAESIGSDLSSKAYTSIISQTYTYHVNTNSSNLIAVIANYTSISVNFIINALRIISSFFTSLGLITGLLYVDTKFTIYAMFFLGISYLTLIYSSKQRLLSNSKQAVLLIERQLKILQESIGSIRDIIIGNNQNYFISLFKTTDRKRRYIDGESQFLASSPRFLIEAMGIILLISISLFSVIIDSEVNSETTSIFPLLGAMALGCQRLLPSLQQSYAALTALRHDRNSVESLMRIVNLPIKQRYLAYSHTKKINFTQNIEFRNVSFRYKNSNEDLFNSINLIVKKGERIGIVGESGCGKSTFIDLLLGLVDPSRGEILVDGIKLNDNSNGLDEQTLLPSVAHVPQMIYLSDSTFAQNIAFGIPEEKMDLKLIKRCAKNACIDKFIESLPSSYQSKVGEQGIKISGGQRQRIGIARALYTKAKLLILDEATSALDNKTESLVMESIRKLNSNMTIVMVAHRLSTLDFCDKVYRVRNGLISLEP